MTKSKPRSARLPRKQTHEGMQLIGAGAMAEYQGDARAFPLRRCIKERRNAIALADFNGEFFRFYSHSNSKLSQVMVHMQVSQAEPIAFRHRSENRVATPFEISFQVRHAIQQSL